MNLKPDIDLANKCGSCIAFRPISGTCNGYCLQNKYGDDVVCDPEHPYWTVGRSRLKCGKYRTQPLTNADKIRAMSDEELAELIDNCVTGEFWRVQVGVATQSKGDWLDFLRQEVMPNDS